MGKINKRITFSATKPNQFYLNLYINQLNGPNQVSESGRKTYPHHKYVENCR